MIIFGSNNKAVGQKLFISTDNMIVNANNTFVYNGGSANNRITGNNIMRTRRYEFNFDEIDAIMSGYITKCIKIVRRWEMMIGPLYILLTLIQINIVILKTLKETRIGNTSLLKDIKSKYMSWQFFIFYFIFKDLNIIYFLNSVFKTINSELNFLMKISSLSQITLQIYLPYSLIIRQCYRKTKTLSFKQW